MRKRASAVLLVLLLSTALVSGCAPARFTLRVEADPEVSWRLNYEYHYNLGGGAAGSSGQAVDGSGNWEFVVPNDEGNIIGVLLEVVEKPNPGKVTISILKGDKVAAQDEAIDPGEGARCIWGNVGKPWGGP